MLRFTPLKDFILIEPQKLIPILRLVGPGGAGKSTVGALLAKNLGWPFTDLDECFMAREGSIPAYIQTHGYVGYARTNLLIYKDVMRSTATPSVVALSSGFVTYSHIVYQECPTLLSEIESDKFSILLLPSFELESCVDIIMRRQLSRPYLQRNAIREDKNIRERFPKFMSMKCSRFLSCDAPEIIASQIEDFVLNLVQKKG